MVQESKIKAVESTAERLGRAQSVIVLDNQGLSVSQMNTLRRRLGEVQGELKVVKNRLAKRALEQTGCEALDDVLTGPVALAFGYSDPVGPARVCQKFAGENDRLRVKAGLLNRRRINAERVDALARLPGRAQLLTQMASTLKSPARRMASVLNQAMAKIVYAMKARARAMEG